MAAVLVRLPKQYGPGDVDLERLGEQKDDALSVFCLLFVCYLADAQLRMRQRFFLTEFIEWLLGHRGSLAKRVDPEYVGAVMAARDELIWCAVEQAAFLRKGRSNVVRIYGGGSSGDMKAVLEAYLITLLMGEEMQRLIRIGTNKEGRRCLQFKQLGLGKVWHAAWRP